MDKKKTLQYNFTFEAIPLLFHSQTSGFIKHLEKDGVNFLKFWWNHVGDQLEEDKRVTPAGLTYCTEKYDEKTIIFYYRASSF